MGPRPLGRSEPPLVHQRAGTALWCPPGPAGRPRAADAVNRSRPLPSRPTHGRRRTMIRHSARRPEYLAPHRPSGRWLRSSPSAPTPLAHRRCTEPWSATSWTIRGLVSPAQWSPSRGRTRTRTTEQTTPENGTYSFANLLPGTYDVVVTLAGFKTFTVENRGPAHRRHRSRRREARAGHPRGIRDGDGRSPAILQADSAALQSLTTAEALESPSRSRAEAIRVSSP